MRSFKTRSLFLHLHLADAFIQGNLKMRTMETIKINKRAMIQEWAKNREGSVSFF